jgi:hypothetical protein
MHGWSAEFVFLIISECKLCWWNGVPTQLWLWSFDKLTVRCARMLGSGDCRFGDMGNWTDCYNRAKLVVQYPWSGEPSTSNQASWPSSWKTATLHCSHWASYCVWQFGGKLTVMGSTVLFVDADSVQDQVVSKGSLQKMALSPNDANFLTWFLYNSYLLVLYIEFSKILSKLSTEVWHLELKSSFMHMCWVWFEV